MTPISYVKNNLKPYKILIIIFYTKVIERMMTKNERFDIENRKSY